MSVLYWRIQNWIPHCEMCLHRCQDKGKKTSSLNGYTHARKSSAFFKLQFTLFAAWTCCWLLFNFLSTRMPKSFPAEPLSTQSTVAWDCSIADAQLHICWSSWCFRQIISAKAPWIPALTFSLSTAPPVWYHQQTSCEHTPTLIQVCNINLKQCWSQYQSPRNACRHQLLARYSTAEPNSSRLAIQPDVSEMLLNDIWRTQKNLRTLLEGSKKNLEDLEPYFKVEMEKNKMISHFINNCA